MEKVVIKSNLRGVLPSEETQPGGHHEDHVRMRSDRSVQTNPITKFQHFSNLHGSFPVPPQQQGRKGRQTGDQSHKHSRPRNPSQLGEPDKVVETHRVKSHGRGSPACQQSLTRGDGGDLHGLGGALTQTHLLLVSSDELNPKIDSQAEDHHNKGLRDDVQMTDRHRGQTEGDDHTGQQGGQGQQGARKLSVGKEKHDGDQGQRDDRGNLHVVLALPKLVVQ